jgi:hypothetical protein
METLIVRIAGWLLFNKAGDLPVPKKVDEMSEGKTLAAVFGAFGLFVVGLIVYCVVVF